MSRVDNGGCSEIQLDPADVRILTDIGFIALTRGHMRHAREIFDAIALLSPGSDASIVGEAMFWLIMNKPEQALRHLRNAPPTDAVRAFLGIALQRAGKTGDALEVLAEVRETAPPGPCREVCNAAMKEYQREETDSGRSFKLEANGHPFRSLERTE